MVGICPTAKGEPLALVWEYQSDGAPDGRVVPAGCDSDFRMGESWWPRHGFLRKCQTNVDTAKNNNQYG